MKNVDVLVAFINGESGARTRTLYIDGNKLFNYNTCIAERTLEDDGDSFVVNVSKYSNATTTIQNALLRMIPNPENKLRCVVEIPQGADSLS